LVEEGIFRGDLQARVNGAEVTLLPLRQRREEILRLYRHALSELPETPPVLSAAFIERLCVYDWPFNVRELVQLARLLAVSQKSTLLAEDLPERFCSPRTQLSGPRTRTQERSSAPPGRREAWMLRHAQELSRLKAALDRTGNVSRAAREAGVPRYRALRLLAAEAEMDQERAVDP
jgi:transcriptional regulator of acetoin/glycerol metabolism